MGEHPVETEIDTPEQIVSSLRTTFRSGRTIPLKHRMDQLRALLRMCEELEDEMIKASEDIRKSRHETVIVDVLTVTTEIKYFLQHLPEWMKPEKPPKECIALFDSTYILRDPYGVVLIMGSWNYPFQTALKPLCGAIAGGNCVVLKPSEIAPGAAKFFADYIPKYLDGDTIKICTGGIGETTELLRQKFDYIFFTGSERVGRIIHSAANKHLIPTTLELGGKCPVYLDKSTNIEIATKRILWGKFLNSGQTCVAPDYLICSKEVQEKFLTTSKRVIEQFFGNNPKSSPDYVRIINEKQFHRLTALLKGCDIAIGGETDSSENYLAPTIVINAKMTDPIMQEEIFGPVLPIVNIENAEEVVRFLKDKPKPLAFYIFTEDKQQVEMFLEKTYSGGVTVNDTIIHTTLCTLPFGGVGSSGMGAYHGKYSFDTFTHKKAVLHKDLGPMGEKLLALRYYPLSLNDEKIMKWIFVSKWHVPFRYLSRVVLFGLGVATGYGLNHFREVIRYLEEYSLSKRNMAW